MKIIINNKTNEVIRCDTLNRSLDNTDKGHIFNIYITTNDPNDMDSMKYLIQYVEKEKITNYKLYNEDNELLLDSGEIETNIINFSDSYSDLYFSTNANFAISEEQIHDLNL